VSMDILRQLLIFRKEVFGLTIIANSLYIFTESSKGASSQDQLMQRETIHENTR